MITITREKNLIRGWGWSWLYNVSSPGEYDASGKLYEVRKIAKKRQEKTGFDIIETWKETTNGR